MSHTTQQPDEPGTDESFRAELADVRAQIDEIEEAITEMAEQISELRDERDELRADLETQSNRITWHGDTRSMGNLRIDNIPVGKAIEKRREEIAELSEMRAKSAETVDTDLEMALSLPSKIRESKYGVTEQRAIALARHLDSVSGPRGATVDKQLRRLLERECDVNLAWIQVYRACEKLESMTNGAIRYVESNDGANRLVVEDTSVLP